jgi:HD-like signal output (HDOD) protein/ActR/RegA family two-component response regulator
MPRILFVDDEPMILNSMRMRLGRRRPEWDCVYVESGAEALAALTEGPVDVVVTDMRMPGMDGGTLLGIVRERYPHTFRMVLSGQMNRDAQLRALPVTHRFLVKPCLPAQLEAHISAALEMHQRLDNPALADLIGGIRQLPSSPMLYAELTRMIADPNVGVAQISRVVERDAGITARLLHVANSAFFGVRRQIRTTLEAINWLGVDLVRKLVLSCELGQLAAQADLPARLIDDLQSHAILTARIASRLVRPELTGTVATAALLHNVGKLIFALAPAEMRARYELATAAGQTELRAQRFAFGCDYPTAGAFLLNYWGLPLDIVQAVALHCEPNAAETAEGIDAPGAVHVASNLAIAAARFDPHTPPLSHTGVDLAYLETAGLSARLSEWCVLARGQRIAMVEPTA